MRNVIGRGNLITCGRTDELAHAVWTYSRSVAIAFIWPTKTALVRKAVVSVHRPLHSKITLTYSLTWLTDRCSPRRMALKALLNTKAAHLLGFAQVSSALKLPKRAPTETQLRSTTCVGTPTIRPRSIRSSLYLPNLLRMRTDFGT